MLKGISPILSPELLAAICSMGHGEEIVLADAHYPANRYSRNVIRADGLAIPALLEALLPLFELDAYVENPVVMMAPVDGDQLDPNVEISYREIIARHNSATPPPARLERFAFYERTTSAFAIVATGDINKYANVILTKGVTPV
ncbi:MAG: L-fucose mutarotase [Verrucomicrobiales bacterium]|nr:L-fucose mutarotase [Verrucomicrobiales bacterium]